MVQTTVSAVWTVNQAFRKAEVEQTPVMQWCGVMVGGYTKHHLNQWQRLNAYSVSVKQQCNNFLNAMILLAVEQL